jgi:hypothetical protein
MDIIIGAPSKHSANSRWRAWFKVSAAVNPFNMLAVSSTSRAHWRAGTPAEKKPHEYEAV